MNKNFEEEYKNYVLSDIPDLWDRIEKGIDEISAESTLSDADENEVVSEESSNVQITETVVPMKKKADRKGHGRRAWISLAVAACICGVVIVPLALRGALGIAMNNKNETALSMSDTDSMMMEDCAATEEMPEVDNASAQASGLSTNTAGDTVGDYAGETDDITQEAPSKDVPEVVTLENCPQAKNVLIRIDSEEIAEEGTRYSFTLLEGNADELLIENNMAQVIMLPDQEPPVVGESYYVNLYWQTAHLSSMPIYEMEYVVAPVTQ